MGWDASRPVPWRRLVREWVLYAAIMTAVFAVVFRDGERLVPILGGLLASGPLYLALGVVLAKFGYTRKTLADLRTPRASPSSRRGGAGGTGDDEAAAAPRPRPAPTRRTSTGPNRPRSRRR